LKKYGLGKWDLSDLVKNPKSPAFEKQIKLVEKKAKHFEETGHPVMEAVHDHPWKWCYVHKDYY